MYECVVTTNCLASLATMHDQLHWSELVQFSGARLAPERVDELGKKLESMPTLKIRELSGSMVTVVKKMLLSMNFVEVSIFPTSYGGSTAIRSLWKKKVLKCRCKQQSFGSRPIFLQNNGSWM